ncbi:MAG: phenylacetic acid degradation protein [Paracoccus denitrificans]|nr:MAG: phenylacetic acid degradation protein [Paracoccus denitrificans]PZO84443.1 MAG: phenylacetic acid degradation protein [Paracoccus denitrificans]
MDKAQSDQIVASQPFAQTLGARVVSFGPDEYVAEVKVDGAVLNGNGVMHGGAIMALADFIGGAATYAHLPDGMATTTIESKTNFLRPVRDGETARASAKPLHTGKTTHVWQTTITRDDGKVCAIVTQTQLVMKWQG